MTKRSILNNQRFMVTKPGFDVFDTNLTDDQKIFDSRWQFTELRVANGYFDSNALIASNTGVFDTINFTDAGIPPAIRLEAILGTGNITTAPADSTRYMINWYEPILVGEPYSTFSRIDVTSSSFTVHWKWKSGASFGRKQSFAWTAFAQRLVT